MTPNVAADRFPAPEAYQAIRGVASFACLLLSIASTRCEADEREAPQRPAPMPVSTATPEVVDLATWYPKLRDDPAAQRTSLGKRFQIAGWVHDFVLVGVADGGKPKVAVVATPLDKSQPTDHSKVLTCRAREAHPWEKFNKGDRVTVVGTFKRLGAGYSSFYLMLDDCTFKAPQGKPVPTLTVDEFAARATADPIKFYKEYDCRWIVLKGKVLALERPSEEQLPYPVLFESPKWQILGSNAEICRTAIQASRVGEEVKVFGHAFIFLPGEQRGRVQLTAWYRYPK